MGRVLDSNSKQPIAFASLKSGYQQSITDKEGAFKIKAKMGETIVISHIGFQAMLWKVGESTGTPIEIFLEEKVVELNEVEVNAFVSEERFKNEILNAVPKYDYENKLASRNLQLIKQVYQLGYFYDYSSYNTFFKNVKSVNEVSFFSSNPSVGILKAIRQMGLRKKLESSPFPNQPIKAPLHPFGVRKQERQLKNYFEPN